MENTTGVTDCQPTLDSYNMQNYAQIEAIYYNLIPNPNYYNNWWPASKQYERGFYSSGLVQGQTSVQNVKLQQNQVTVYQDWFSASLKQFKNNFYQVG